MLASSCHYNSSVREFEWTLPLRFGWTCRILTFIGECLGATHAHLGDSLKSNLNSRSFVVSFLCMNNNFLCKKKKEFNSPVEVFVHKACKMYCKYICVTFTLIHRFELSNFETIDHRAPMLCCIKLSDSTIDDLCCQEIATPWGGGT
jgi:hypothetical protein